MQQELPSFDTKQFATYDGENPFILQLIERFSNDINFNLTMFENEYLVNNFKYSGYGFPRMQINVGSATEKRIQKEFALDRAVPHVYVDTLIGETEEWYHTSCRTQKGLVYFWLFKVEIGNLYELVYTHNSQIDFEALNAQFNGKNLMTHQERAVDFLAYHKRCFLLDTAGNGKTYSSIAAAIATDCQKILIVCLSGLKKNWSLELKEWSETAKVISGENNWSDTPSRFTIINFDILANYHQKGKGKTSLLLAEKFDCIIVDEIQKIRKTTSQRSKVIADLCASQSVKYVWGLSGTPIAKNEEFLNLCMNLNISISDLIYTPKHYHYLEYSVKNADFIERYCYGLRPKGNRTFWVKGKKVDGIMQHNSNTHELHQRTKHLQLRRRTENSVEGFPDKTRDKLWTTFTSKEQQEYNELFDNYLQVKGLNDEVDKLFALKMKELKTIFTENQKFYDFEKYVFRCVNDLNKIKDQTTRFNDSHENIVKSYADNTLAKIEKIIANYREHIIKCEKLEKEEKIDQITKFEVKIPKDIEKNRVLIETILLRQYLAIKKVPHTVKFVKDEIEDGNNVIIFTHFIEEFNLLAANFKSNGVMVRGGSTEKKQAAVDEFMTNPKKNVIIGNITTLGTGFNITKADVVMFNSPNWDGSEHEQAEKRAWRIGRKELVKCYYHLFDGSIEERVFDISENKKTNSEIFLGDEKSTPI
jgi:SNF2 family DNA or RNA helicase